METDEVKPKIEEEETEEKPPYPKKEWFGQKELDVKTLIIDYTYEGEDAQVAFDIEAKNPNEVKLISAECEEMDEALGMMIPSQEKLHDRLLLEAVSYDGKKLSQQNLDELKRNKKYGIYEELVYQVLIQCGMTTPLTILSQKK